LEKEKGGKMVFFAKKERFVDELTVSSLKKKTNRRGVMSGGKHGCTGRKKVKTTGDHKLRGDQGP